MKDSVRGLCMRAALCAGLFACMALLSSCFQSRVVSAIEEEELFTLSYGNFEDQVNVFDMGEVGDVPIRLAMRDGFFYVTNGQSKKVMEFNSYGDLLSLYYNEDNNPEPSFLKAAQAATATRKAVRYPFNEISEIAIDSRKFLYAVDTLPLERQELDEGSGQMLGQIVLRFSDSGSFVDYLGQQGPGGTPFPFIQNLYATNSNELVVVCTTNAGAVVYWFSTEGYLLFTVPIEKQSVPGPSSEEKNDVWLKIDSVVPDSRERRLYVKVDYYVSQVDEASRVQSGIVYKESLLHALDVLDGSYGRPISVPAYTERVTEGFSSQTYSVPYELLGVTESGWFFFIVTTGEGFSLQMMQGDGQRILQRRLRVDRRKNLFYTFSLGNTGILSVFLVQTSHATVAWWRTDSLIQAILKN